MIARKPLPAVLPGKRSLESAAAEPEMTKAARILGISTESPDYALTRPKTGDPQYGRHHNFASPFSDPFNAPDDADAELSDGSADDGEMDLRTPTHGLTAMPKSKPKFLSWQRKSGSSTTSKGSAKQSFSSRWRSSGDKTHEQRPQTAVVPPSTEKRSFFARPSSTGQKPAIPAGPIPIHLQPLPSLPVVSPPASHVGSPSLPAQLANSPHLSIALSSASSDKPLPPLPVPLPREMRLSSFSAPLPATDEKRSSNQELDSEVKESTAVIPEKPAVAPSTDKTIPGTSQDLSSAAPRRPRRTPTDESTTKYIGNGLGLMTESHKTAPSSEAKQVVKEAPASKAVAEKIPTVMAEDFPAVPRHSTSTMATSHRSNSPVHSLKAASSVESIAEGEVQTRHSQVSGTSEQICMARSVRVMSVSGSTRSVPASQRKASVDEGERRSSVNSWGRRSTMTKRSVSSTMTASDLTKQSVLSLSSSDSERSSVEDFPHHVEQIAEEDESEDRAPQPMRPASESSNFSRKISSRRASNRTTQRESQASVASTSLTIPSVVPSVPRLSVASLMAKPLVQPEEPIAENAAPHQAAAEPFISPIPFTEPLWSPTSTGSVGKVMMLSKNEIALIKALREEKSRKAQLAAQEQAIESRILPLTELMVEPVMEPVTEAPTQPAVKQVEDQEPLPAPKLAEQATEDEPDTDEKTQLVIQLTDEPEELRPKVAPKEPLADLIEKVNETKECFETPFAPSGESPSRSDDPVAWKLPELSFSENTRSSRGSLDFRLSLNFENNSSFVPHETLLSQRSKIVPDRSRSNSTCPHLEESLPTPPTSRCSPLTPTLAHQVMSSFVLPLNIQARPSSSEVVSQSRPPLRHHRRRTASSDCLFLDSEPTEVASPEESDCAQGRRGWSKDLWSGLDDLDLVG